MRSSVKMIVTPAAILAFSCACAFGAEPNKASNQAQHFINKAWNINTAEIKLGHLAQKRSTNDLVKNYAQRLIKDHTNLNDQLTNLAKQADATLPKHLNKQNQQVAKKLTKLRGSEFDKEYIDTMIHGHEGALYAFRKESQIKDRTPLVIWAGQAAPILKEHLKLAEQVGRQIGAPAAQDTAQPAGAIGGLPESQ